MARAVRVGEGREVSASLYCERCDVAWPHVPGYGKCPGCTGSTTSVPGMVALGTNEAAQKAVDLAASRDRHAAFEAFCAERDAPKIEAEATKFRAELDAFRGVPG